jgi:hypothetical protein
MSSNGTSAAGLESITNARNGVTDHEQPSPPAELQPREQGKDLPAKAGLGIPMQPLLPGRDFEASSEAGSPGAVTARLPSADTSEAAAAQPVVTHAGRWASSLTETNRICLVLIDMNNRIFGPYLEAIHRSLSNAALDSAAWDSGSDRDDDASDSCLPPWPPRPATVADDDSATELRDFRIHPLPAGKGGHPGPAATRIGDCDSPEPTDSPHNPWSAPRVAGGDDDGAVELPGFGCAVAGGSVYDAGATGSDAGTSYTDALESASRSSSASFATAHLAAVDEPDASCARGSVYDASCARASAAADGGAADALAALVDLSVSSKGANGDAWGSLSDASPNGLLDGGSGAAQSARLQPAADASPLDLQVWEASPSVGV